MVETRWNSTYKMINITILLKPALKELNKTINIKSFKLAYLTLTEWEALVDLNKILEVFYEPII